MLISKSLIQSWIALQHQLIGGLQVAYVGLRGRKVSTGHLSATYPEQVERQHELALAAELAQRSGAPVIGNAQQPDQAEPRLRIAYPLQLGADTEGAVVVEVEAPLSRQAAIIELLKWGEAWLNLAVGQQDSTDLPDLTGMIDTAMASAGFNDALTASLQHLARLSGCTRVALGLVGAGQTRLAAVSDITELDTRSARAKAVTDAMHEAVEQRATLFSQRGGTSLPPAQARLIDKGGLSAVCSVPLNVGLATPQVYLFEFADSTQAGPHTPAICNEAARVAALLVDLKRARSRGWWQRLGGLLADGWGELRDRRRGWRRFLPAIIVILLAFVAFGRADYRVSAPAVVEGAVQRAVVAPFDGFIAEARVRAGQAVSAGDLLAQLDDRDLRSERRRLDAEYSELEKQHRQAVATRNLKDTTMLEAQLAQARAKLALLDEKLQRTQLRAPIDGQVISGDWSRAIGAPVSRGDIVFEVAPLRAYRVALQVSDGDIAGMQAGQLGDLMLTSMPNAPFGIRLTDIATLADNTAEQPGFRVEALPTRTHQALRPGMEGVAKVNLGRHPRWWIWSHHLTDWLRLQWWRWTP